MKADIGRNIRYRKGKGIEMSTEELTAFDPPKVTLRPFPPVASICERIWSLRVININCRGCLPLLLSEGASAEGGGMERTLMPLGGSVNIIISDVM